MAMVTGNFARSISLAIFLTIMPSRMAISAEMYSVTVLDLETIFNRCATSPGSRTSTRWHRRSSFFRSCRSQSQRSM